MSHYVVFNLDELSSLRFQELCNALLLKYFSELLHCMVRPGRDGQCDGRLNCIPIDYSDLLDYPFMCQSIDGKNSLWFFQAKHTQMGDDAPRQRAVLNALKDEIARWKRKKKEERPTHYFLLTNVNLKAANEKLIRKLGKDFFGYFDIWHEPKISCLIAGDLAIQKAFYPNRLTSLEFVSKETLKDFMGEVVVKQEMATSQPVGNYDLDIKDMDDSIRALVDYEIRFQKANVFFEKEFKILTYSQNLPQEWTSYTYKAKGSGILVLSENIEELHRLTDKIARNEVNVTMWDRHLGEEVSEGDTIITLACDSEIEPQLAPHLDSIFTIIPSQNPAYGHIDLYLRELESRIINDIKKSKIHDVQDGLQKMFHLRKSYSFFKADFSNAFYPNARTFAGKPVIGWDFIYLWESIFRNIYDVAFGDRIPESLSESLLSIPFVLCGEAIRKKRSKESYQIELESLKIPLGMITKKNDGPLLHLFLDKLENLALVIKDLDCQIETFDQADWAFSIITATAKYIADLGWLSLSERLPEIPFDQLDKILILVTSLSFQGLFSVKNQQKDIYTKQKELQKAITLIREEYLFAWATFEWFQKRIEGDLDPTRSVSLLKRLKMRNAVLFYTQNKFARSGWINSWFIPEGKRVSWSWAIDHDIRESLQLAVLTLPINKDDFIELKELDDPAWHKQFLQEIKEMHSKLNSDFIGNNFASIEAVLEEAHNEHKENLKRLIKDQHISIKRTEEINEEFQKKMSSEDLEGILYSIIDIKSQRGLKPSHVIGPYFIDNKNYYIDRLGSISFLSGSIGNAGAEAFISQREKLLIECARKSAVCTEYNLNQLEEVLAQICNACQEDYLIIVSLEIMTQIYDSKMFKERTDSDNKCFCGKIGNINFLFFTFLEPGEILVVPKLGLNWCVERKITKLEIKVIDEGSELAKRFLETNPNLELGEKVLVDGREKGIMVSLNNNTFKHYKLKQYD